MKLVVDANVLFAALLKNGKTRDLFLLGDFVLFASLFLFEEFEKYLPSLSERTHVSPKELREMAHEFIKLADVSMEPVGEEDACLGVAKRISPDENDVQYLALALKLNAPLWSNDKMLKRQRAVKIVTTAELLDLLRERDQ